MASAKQRVVVNGTEYDTVVESSGWIICSSTRHDSIVTLTAEEFQMANPEFTYRSEIN